MVRVLPTLRINVDTYVERYEERKWYLYYSSMFFKQPHVYFFSRDLKVSASTKII